MKPDLRILKLYKEWSKQGRSAEEKWAVMNFLTGTGLRINDIMEDEVRQAVDRGYRLAKEEVT